MFCLSTSTGCTDNDGEDKENLEVRKSGQNSDILEVPSIGDFFSYYSQALQAGDLSEENEATDLPAVRDFDSTLESMLNSNGEIVVGNKYVRFFNDQSIAVVPTYDNEARQLVSGWTTTHFTADRNIKLLGLEDSSSNLYDKDDNGALVEKDHVDLNYTAEFKDNAYKLTNRSFVSFVDDGPHEFKWIVNDEEIGTEEVLYLPEEPDQVLSLALYKGDDKIKETKKDTLYPREDPCDYFVKVLHLGGCRYRFLIFWLNPDGENPIVVLPDGSRHVANAVVGEGATVDISIQNVICHDDVFFFGIELPGYCEASWQYSMPCPDCDGCGKKDDVRERHSIGNIRVTKKLWISQNVFGLHIGSFTKTQRKRWGLWISKGVDEVYTSFEAVMRDESDGCSDLVVPFGGESEDKSSYVARNIDLRGHTPRYFPNIDLVRSTHRVTIDGQVYNLPPLILQ